MIYIISYMAFALFNPPLSCCWGVAGEDRWLCTLMLQQGYRVEYCAASDALTYAPEGFYEFFNQRRRWGPSTMANIMDLLMDWKHTVKVRHSTRWGLLANLRWMGLGVSWLYYHSRLKWWALTPCTTSLHWPMFHTSTEQRRHLAAIHLLPGGAHVL